ncbi:Uncharacterised protein [uncultured archaeon]|nr:Uncharacterised protein [uncultured archaeon]
MPSCSNFPILYFTTFASTPHCLAIFVSGILASPAKEWRIFRPVSSIEKFSTASG